MSTALEVATAECLHDLHKEVYRLIEHINKDKESLGKALLESTAMLAAVVTLLCESGLLNEEELNERQEKLKVVMKQAADAAKGATP
jgi:TPP-dependent pyruvate/acetoin dehydrogenase alpha subunit